LPRKRGSFQAGGGDGGEREAIVLLHTDQWLEVGVEEKNDVVVVVDVVWRARPFLLLFFPTNDPQLF